jgi:large subunit ribosomal protein L22
MESKAILRFSGISASKMRQVADIVRGKDVPVALHSLQFITKAAARPMSKLISSAVANAREKYNVADERFDPDLLFVKTVHVDEGPTAKRFRPRAQGRAYRIRKRSCHVNLILGAHEVKAAPRKPRAAAAKKTEGTEPKAESKRGKKQKTAAAAK